MSSPPDLDFQAHPAAKTALSVTTWNQLRGHFATPLVVRRERYERGETTGAHRHADFLALYAVRGGRGTHVVNGEAFPVARGDLYLLQAGATHGYTGYQRLEIDAFYFTLGAFTPDEIEALQTFPGLWPLLAPENVARLQRRLHLAPGVWPRIETQIEELRHEWEHNSLDGALLLRSGFFRLLVLVAREHAACAGVGAGAGNARAATGRSAGLPTKTPSTPIVESLRALEADCARGWTVAELAAQSFLSPSQFSKLFAQEVGMPPASYLKQLRLDQARSLLRDTALPLGRIAFECGFADAAHFSRAFRGAYGLAPSQFRAQSRAVGHTS